MSAITPSVHRKDEHDVSKHWGSTHAHGSNVFSY